MPSFAGLASYACMLLVGFLVGHFELHTTVPTQLVTSFTQMEHKVRAKLLLLHARHAKLRCTRAVPSWGDDLRPSRCVALRCGQHTVLGAFVGLSLVYFVLLLPLYTLAVDEST